jgi:hypothetical protein
MAFFPSLSRSQVQNALTPASATLAASVDSIVAALVLKQALLVSGGNIKTINDISLLGAGNITIAGGGGAWGTIAGTLSAQSDLQAALNGKADSGHTHSGLAPSGGTTAYVLTKNSNTNYDYSWQPSAGGGGATWGSIGGTLSGQADLQNELHSNASYYTANAMAGLAIDTSKAINTKTITVDSTLTFSAAPANANTYFGLVLTNGGATDLTVTIPNSYSEAQQAAITSFVMPASAVVEIVWRYTGATYILKGEPVRQPFQAAWSFIGTTTARDYPVILKTARPFVITSVVSKCASGTATATGKIDGVALGGTANAVSSTEVEQAIATARTAVLDTDLAIGFTAGAVDPQISFRGYYL